MLLRIPAEEIFIGEYGWHTGRFHFSFADYVDPENPRFGVLRALNDFVLQPGSGFETHPHDEMEIISYCVEGELIHGDGMGHRNTLQSGDVQYLCAGSGITHSEMNKMPSSSLRFLQIWITPNRSGLKPKYRYKQFSRINCVNQLQHIASGEALDGVIKIAQDANIYAARLEKRVELAFTNRVDRQSYLACLEGKLTANDIELNQHDGLKVWGEVLLTMTAVEESHFLLVEMALESKVFG